MVLTLQSKDYTNTLSFRDHVTAYRIIGIISKRCEEELASEKCEWTFSEGILKIKSSSGWTYVVTPEKCNCTAGTFNRPCWHRHAYKGIHCYYLDQCRFFTDDLEKYAEKRLRKQRKDILEFFSKYPLTELV